MARGEGARSAMAGCGLSPLAPAGTDGAAAAADKGMPVPWLGREGAGQGAVCAER